MKTTPKTDECIRMLREAQNVFTSYHYRGDSYFDDDNKSSLIDFQNRIHTMICYRLLPMCVIKADDNVDKYSLKAFLKKNDFDVDDFENVWYVMQNYQLVTADDLKNEFWGICPDLASIPSFLDVINVKFKDVRCHYETDIAKIKEHYNGLDTLVELGKITKKEADTMYWNIHFIAEKYNFAVDYISAIYKEFRTMVRPQQLQNNSGAGKKQPQQLHFTRSFTDTERQNLFNGLISGKFIPKDTNRKHFNFVFGGAETDDFKPLKWDDTPILLGYFIDMWFSENKIWNKTEFCFTINGKLPNTNSIKNSISKLKFNKKYVSYPKNADKIDYIMNNL